MNSSRLLISRQSHRLFRRSPPVTSSAPPRSTAHRIVTRPSSSSSNSSAAAFSSAQPTAAGTAILLTAAALLYTTTTNNAKNNEASLCSVAPRLGAEPTMLSPATEPKTGILFPRLCNGMTFVGCGVRVKYGFVKVYAVGTYMDPLAMSVIKDQSKPQLQKALLDPNYPRTIRIVMNRNLSIEKYTAAIIEALEPRMKGQDLESLEEFKKLNPPVDLIQGAEMEMTVRGDTLLYKNAVGGIGQIRSGVFTSALCDVFYGAEAVSPGHLEDVLKGVKKL
mmetsp:Transcript_15375/g.23226  ORF Transcript_15375/g.23226 Transcript_15375/m.23226 type:complete len:278 (+) Transcript_15375:42-875(+)